MEHIAAYLAHLNRFSHPSPTTEGKRQKDSKKKGKKSERAGQLKRKQTQFTLILSSTLYDSETIILRDGRL